MAVIDLCFEFRRQSFIDGLDVGPQSIATDFRDFVGAQHRTQRGFLAPTDVRMPIVFDADGFFVFREADHIWGFAPWQERMDFELAETCGEGCVLLARNVLVTKEQDLEFDECRPEIVQQARGHRLREVHATNLGTETGTKERRFELIEAERVESLSLIRDMSTRSIMNSLSELYHDVALPDAGSRGATESEFYSPS
jgi:hypothetical protein